MAPIVIIDKAGSFVLIEIMAQLHSFLLEPLTNGQTYRRCQIFPGFCPILLILLLITHTQILARQYFVLEKNF